MGGDTRRQRVLPETRSAGRDRIESNFRSRLSSTSTFTPFSYFVAVKLSVSYLLFTEMAAGAILKTTGAVITIAVTIFIGTGECYDIFIF